jgi:hypothetical protein
MTTFTGMGVEAAPFVPDRGPEPPSTRAQLAVFKRRARAARVRRYNLTAAAEIENPNAVLADQWRAAALASEREAASVRREAERQAAAFRAAEDFADARARFRLAADRAQFMRSRGSATVAERMARDRQAYRGGTVSTGEIRRVERPGGGLGWDRIR